MTTRTAETSSLVYARAAGLGARQIQVAEL
jgi:hypothetical protein